MDIQAAQAQVLDGDVEDLVRILIPDHILIPVDSATIGDGEGGGVAGEGIPSPPSISFIYRFYIF